MFSDAFRTLFGRFSDVLGKLENDRNIFAIIDNVAFSYRPSTQPSRRAAAAAAAAAAVIPNRVIYWVTSLEPHLRIPTSLRIKLSSLQIHDEYSNSTEIFKRPNNAEAIQLELLTVSDRAGR